ncbi:hypothetical protein PPBDW_p0093 (plasmid) [Photobacterium kishitanii]|nr:hypothetical protein PPBDW_p0093 [Photobacterium kishitanii]
MCYQTGTRSLLSDSIFISLSTFNMMDIVRPSLQGFTLNSEPVILFKQFG